MAEIRFELPYGRGTLPAALDRARLKAVLENRLPETPPDSAENLVEKALECPAGSPPLRELARGARSAVVIISDHTRPVPSRVILPPMLRQIREASPGVRVTLLVATGCHRAPTEAELRAKLGDDIYARETIAVHDCDSEENLVTLGTLPSGQRLRINRLAAEADLLVSEGFIEPHFFAGFSGGPKSVLPGIAARETVVGNHCAEFIDSPFARTGVLENNPIHRDMEWAARKAGLRFILNVVLNPGKQTVAAFAGDPIQAHLEGCRYLKSLCRVQAEQADIVITTNGGYPLDQNVYQAVKGMTAAEAAVKQGGVIIMLAAASDGCGGEAFFRQISETEPAKQLAAFRSRPRGQTLPDQWQTQIFLRVLSRAKIIFISECPDETVRAMRMTPAHSVEEALAIAETLLGRPDASVTVIPDGVSVIADAPLGRA
ncbi:MAG: nickel-dependent lactate racemase [Clostridiales bacterium]|nr:nickel-dependent lactate racemase [Clostridiales bacterium]